MKKQSFYTVATFSVFLACVISFSACDLLDVENPNTLTEEELDNPAASRAMADGIQSSVTRALGYVLAPYSVATDELTWVGSRDAWQELDFGNVGNELNEFTDLAFPYMAEAQWLSQQYIERLEGFREEGVLPSSIILARAYLYGAIIHTAIADMFDNYAFSDRLEGGEAIGEENMDQLYDIAIDYLDKGLALNTPLEAELTAMKARALYSKSLWQKVNPEVNTSDPLVSNSEAAATAEDALALVGEDWRFELEVDPGSDLDSYVAGQINNRLEMRVGNTYIEPSSDDKTVAEVTLQDPIDQTVHPYVQSLIENNYSGRENEFANIIVVSAREMHLIIAENALANGDEEEFAEHINALRQMDGLSNYDGQIPAIEMLERSRQANLFFQGRRLIDHYRFETPSPEWLSGSTAVTDPGTFFPITATEIRSNPNL